MNRNTSGSDSGLTSVVAGRARDGRQYLQAEKAMGEDESAPKGRGLVWHLLPPLSLVALLGLPGVSHALALGSASSSTDLTCGWMQSVVTKPGAALEDCLIVEDFFNGPASASVRTLLGDRPTASVTAVNVGEPHKLKWGAEASAHLTYEVRLVELAAPPGVAFPGVPVTVAVRGEVKRYSELGNATTLPWAIGAAFVTMRSSPNIPWVNGDVLNERAVRTPHAPSQDTPDFDKIVAVSLIPGHTYLVDVVAGCRLSGGSGSFEMIASSSSCSAEADPVFMLDQATLDERLGASSFDLAAYYGFEYSAGVTSPIPEPGSAVLALIGLAGLGVYSRRLRSCSALACAGPGTLQACRTLSSCSSRGAP